MKVQIQTDIGLKREQNEDFVSQFENKAKDQLVVLADGMGGHRAGDIASRFVVTKFGLVFSKTDFRKLSHEKIESWFLEELKKLNEEVVAKGQESSELAEMGTTVIAAYIQDDDCLLMHVGDSRGYLLKNNELNLLTDDHTFVNELYKLKMLTKEEAKKHKDRHRLTQAIGVPFEVKPDLTWFKMGADDLCLLCSDGLTNMVSEKLIEEILNKETSLEVKSQELIDAAKNAGGIDNISVAIFKER